jgi:hypothetical protein
MNALNTYEIRIEGVLPDCWSAWFDGMVIRYDAESETTLIGKLADQASLIGMLTKIHSLNLIVTSVQRLSPED